MTTIPVLRSARFDQVREGDRVSAVLSIGPVSVIPTGDDTGDRYTFDLVDIDGDVRAEIEGGPANVITFDELPERLLLVGAGA
jgi:hypothetical protein